MFCSEFKAWFGEFDEEESKDERDNSPSIAILQKQLAVELIYTILYTITKYTVGSPRDSVEAFKKYDFDSFHEKAIDFMAVKDPKCMEVAEIPDEDSDDGYLPEMISQNIKVFG